MNKQALEIVKRAAFERCKEYGLTDAQAVGVVKFALEKHAQNVEELMSVIDQDDKDTLQTQFRTYEDTMPVPRYGSEDAEPTANLTHWLAQRGLAHEPKTYGKPITSSDKGLNQMVRGNRDMNKTLKNVVPKRVISPEYNQQIMDAYKQLLSKHFPGL